MSFLNWLQTIFRKKNKAVACVNSHGGIFFLVVCGVVVAREATMCWDGTFADDKWTYSSLCEAARKING